ncbi:glycosyltransferase family 1 protein [Hyphomicrobium sp. CS1BSMeth3]|uniref:glycosyltransferase family 4 protein n=1 Tax=Hyphomicrobium sp. CS1BSMeth3 TaxID=1892844 RepID=UPI0009FAF60E|nr:glycosyltransferase family 1 protein [Hyphomicrobium sp. CS1BSMeth3]
MLSSLKLRKSAGVPVSFEVHRSIAEGNKARDGKDWPQAAMAYRTSLERDPSLFHIWLQYGHALKESGEPTEAKAAYLEAAKLRPQSGEPLVHLGHLLNAQGQSAAARQSYMAAARLSPRHPDVFREVHRLAVEGGSKADQEEILKVLEDLSADSNSERTTMPSSIGAARSALAVVAEQLRDTGLSDRAQALEAILADKELLSPTFEFDDAPADNKAAEDVVIFDVSDLMSYFRNARLPTGIQRVQIETIVHLLRTRGRRGVKICAFVERREAWVEVPAAMFGALSQLALVDGDRSAPEWLAALSRLQLMLNMSEPLEMSHGATLINLGTSWWLQNYFLFVRQAKAQQNIRYVPFVHDLIPLMAPEHCTKELTQDFISWLIGVFDHADAFLVNSESTKADLLKAGEMLGHHVSPDAISVVRLDADFRKPGTAELPGSDLAKWALARAPFVLFVSTIESRKNHIGAFEAWIELIRKHGARHVPKLVCVGNKGWLNDAVYAKLASHDALRERVVMLSGLSDAELGLLYRSCLFTLYPSRYEGWGLPVTESLCYGKVPLLSEASSLPEAGGDFAVYFGTRSAASLTEALEKLVFDESYRKALEKKIGLSFRPRPWSDIGEDMVAAVSRRKDRAAVEFEGDYAAPEATSGAYHPIVRNFETRVWRGLRSAEVFRAGGGWWGPDDWGCWTKVQGGELNVGLPDNAKRWRLYLRIHGLPTTSCPYEIGIEETSIVQTGVLKPGTFKWLMFELDSPVTGSTFRISIRGGSTEDLGKVTDGLDPRVVSIGVCGFFLCAADDLIARNNFLEAVSLGNLEDLAFNRERVSEIYAGASGSL